MQKIVRDAGITSRFCPKFSKVEKQISSCSEFCSEGTSNIGIPPTTEFEGFTKGVRQFETKSFTKGVTIFLNISTQDDRSLSQLTKDRKKSVSGIVNKQPDREAVSLVRKGVGQ